MQMRWIRTIAVAAYVGVALASGASADPVSVNGFYSSTAFGAIASNELTLSFPGFTVDIFDNDVPTELGLKPGFIDVNNHSPVPFTQSTGNFSLHSTASGQGTIDADVTGHLSFFGPSPMVDVPSECPPFIFCQQILTVPITMSGFVRIQQGSHLFFNGSLQGSGSATAIYGNFPPSQFWQGTDYSFSAGGQVPEPDSIVLLGSGAAWFVGRRRRKARAVSAVSC
jgi:hypothetical protein